MLEQRFHHVEKERDELYEKFESTIYDVQVISPDLRTSPLQDLTERLQPTTCTAKKRFQEHPPRAQIAGDQRVAREEGEPALGGDPTPRPNTDFGADSRGQSWTPDPLFLRVATWKVINAANLDPNLLGTVSKKLDDVLGMHVACPSLDLPDGCFAHFSVTIVCRHRRQERRNQGLAVRAGAGDQGA